MTALELSTVSPPPVKAFPAKERDSQGRVTVDGWQDSADSRFLSRDKTSLFRGHLSKKSWKSERKKVSGVEEVENIIYFCDPCHDIHMNMHTVLTHTHTCARAYTKENYSAWTPINFRPPVIVTLPLCFYSPPGEIRRPPIRFL